MKTDAEIYKTLNNPVFIVGCPRSGTTWLQRLVISHSDICGGPESSFFIEFRDVIDNLKREKGDGRDSWLLDYWSKESLKKKIYELWTETFSEFVKKEKGNIFCEKSPSHVLRISDIHSLLPQAKFIHIIRDSRSTVASLLASSRGWGKSWAPKTARDAAIMWYLHVTEGKKQGKTLPSGQYMEIHYEDLKKNAASELGRVLDFIGVDYSNDLLQKIVDEQSFDKQKAIGGTRFSVDTAKSEPVGFFNKGQVDSWREDLSLYEKAIVWRYTRKLMAECGYSWKGRVYE